MLCPGLPLFEESSKNDSSKKNSSEEMGFSRNFSRNSSRNFCGFFFIILQLFLSCWCFFLINSMIWRIILSLYFFKWYVFKKYLSIKYLNLVVFWKTPTDLFLYKLLFYLAEWLIGNTYLIISPLHIKKMLFCHFGEFLLILHLEKSCMDFNLEKLCIDFNVSVLRCSLMSN